MSRIDFVTGAPEKYAHLVDDLIQVRTELRAGVNSFSEAEMRLARSDDIWSAKRTLSHIGVYVHLNGVFIHHKGHPFCCRHFYNILGTFTETLYNRAINLT